MLINVNQVRCSLGFFDFASQKFQLFRKAKIFSEAEIVEMKLFSLRFCFAKSQTKKFKNEKFIY
jgi:hypothetical protein